MRRILLYGVALFMLVASNAWAQERVVTGKVSSTEDGSPIPGVNVLLKGTTNGTVTDAEGRYSLTVPSAGGSLIFSFIGLSTEEVAIGERAVVDVSLALDVTQLSEVVVTALGVAREERSLGFSTEKVDSKELTVARTTNLSSALTAKVAGLRVQGSNGMVGASSNIFIRGFTTFTGSNQPLMIVDGIPIDNGGGGNALQAGVSNSNRGIDINQDDIENITVLKGPAAAVLYGSRGASGAIIITTKRGGKQQGNKNSVNLTSSITFSDVNRFPEYQNAYGQGNYGYFNAANEVNSWGEPTDGQLRTNFRGEQEAYTAYPNNVKDLFKQGVNKQLNLSMAGGTDKASYYMSYGNLTETGVLDNNKLVRNTLTFNGSNKFTDKFTAGINFIYTHNVSQRTQQGNQLANPFFRSWFLPRSYDVGNYPFENPDHTQRSPTSTTDLNTNNTWYGGDDNPLFTIKRNTYDDKINRIVGNANLSYEIMPWLTAAYRIGVDSYSQEFKVINSKTSRGGSAASQAGSITDEIFNREEISSYATLTFSKRFMNDDIGVRALLGNEINQRSTRDNGVTGNDIQIIGLENITNTLTFNPFGTKSQVRLIGVFADVSVDYKNTYFLGLTGRNDWSSTFSPDKRSYFYPSVTAAIVFTDAISVLKDNSILSYGKIRANYASVGREAPAYSTDTYYSRSGPADGFGPTILFPFQGQLGQTLNDGGGNSGLGPEFNNSFEVGADLRFFNGRFGLDVAYYKNVSTDIIFSVPVAAASGFTSQIQNAGEMESTGIEVQLNANVLKLGDFRWDITANWSRQRMIVTALAPGVTQITLGGFVTPSTRLIEGEPYGVLFGSVFQRESVDANGRPTGRLLVDNNGRAQLAVDNQIVGNPNPDWFGGITNNFSYKGINLSFLVDFRYGGDIISRNVSDLLRTGSVKETENREDGYIIDGVFADGTPNNIQIHATDYFNDLYGFGRAEFVVLDASWVRLREASISYTLPKSILQNTFIGNVEVGVNGRNLLLYSPNVKHIDPEVNAQGQSNSQGLEFNALPQTRQYGAYVKVTF